MCGATHDDHHGDVVKLRCVAHEGIDFRDHAILYVPSRTPQVGAKNLPQPIFVEESLLSVLRLGDAVGVQQQHIARGQVNNPLLPCPIIEYAQRHARSVQLLDHVSVSGTKEIRRVVPGVRVR